MYIMPSGGGQRVRIEVPTSNNLVPLISPDGRSMCYIVWGDGGDLSMRGIRRPEGDSGWNRAKPLFNLRTINTGGAGWSPEGKWIAFITDTQVFRAKDDGSDPHPIATVPAGFNSFYTRWGGDSRLVYYSGVMPDGRYLIYAVPISGAPAREVFHSEGPTYQNFRFPFEVHHDTLYLSLADRQSDLWMAEMLHP